MRGRTSAPDPQRLWRPGAGLLVLLLLLPTFAVFAPVARNDFINYDDNSYIYENPQVLRGLTPETALWALTSTEQSNWYPLRRLSHLADVSLFGLDAGKHHLVSVAWHAAAAALLFLALRSLTGSLWRSFTAAGLFAVHPLQVESVAWAAERSNVLAGFFFALTLLLWARHARRPGPGRYGAALLCFALGLAAKPVLVTLPPLLLLLDFWPLGRLSAPGEPPWRVRAPLLARRLREQAPLLLLAAGAAAVAIAAHRQTGSISSLETLPPAGRAANAALSYGRYLGKLFWPAELAVFYPLRVPDIPFGRAALAGALLAALTALALRLARRRPWLAAGWLWYAGMLVPTIGLVQFSSQAMADRFAYLPSAGIFLALAWGSAELAPPGRRSRTILAGCAAVALGALGATSTAQTRLWRDSLTLFRQARSVSGEHWIIETKIAFALLRPGRTEEAVAHLREAVRLGPGLAQTRTNLGNALRELGRHGEAEAEFREALRLEPASPEARNNLGIVCHDRGRHREAEGWFREALRLRPDYPDARFNLGNALAAQQRYGEAAAAFAEALRLRPDDADTRGNLAFALWRLGRLEEAAAQYREALRLRPDDALARENLRLLLSRPGRR